MNTLKIWLQSDESGECTISYRDDKIWDEVNIQDIGIFRYIQNHTIALNQLWFLEYAF